MTCVIHVKFLKNKVNVARFYLLYVWELSNGTIFFN